MTAVVNIPASLGGMLLGVYVTGTLYILNSPEATRGIASILIPMMAGLVPFGVVYLIQRVYYAFEDARTPFRLQVIISVVAVVTGLLALLLPQPWVGFGIGVGQTLSNLVGAVVGVVWVRRRLDGLPLGVITRGYVRLTLASLAGAVPARSWRGPCPGPSPGASRARWSCWSPAARSSSPTWWSRAGCGCARSTSCSNRCSGVRAASCPGAERPLG